MFEQSLETSLFPQFTNQPKAGNGGVGHVGPAYPPLDSAQCFGAAAAAGRRRCRVAGDRRAHV